MASRTREPRSSLGTNERSRVAVDGLNPPGEDSGDGGEADAAVVGVSIALCWGEVAGVASEDDGVAARADANGKVDVVAAAIGLSLVRVLEDEGGEGRPKSPSPPLAATDSGPPSLAPFWSIRSARS